MGRITKEQRLLVYKKFDGHCAYCGKEIKLSDMQVDHIIPKNRGCYSFRGEVRHGADDMDNYNPSCRSCNFRKGMYSVEQFRDEIKRQAKTELQRFQSRMSVAYGLIEPHLEREVKFYFEQYGKENIASQCKT